MSVKGASDAHGPRKTPWSVEAPTGVKSSRRLASTNEYGMTVAFAQACHVETLVYAIHKKHVRVSLLAQESAGAASETDPGVACEVARSAVRLGFYDAGHSAPSG